MTRKRMHIPADRWQAKIELTEEERRHLFDVLRLKPGDPVEVFDGRGGVSRALVGYGSKPWKLELGDFRKVIESGPRVRLAIALLKGRKLDGLVRMATEVGVESIEPFNCERSVPRPGQNRMKGRLDRWQMIAAQAARQSGRATIPEIKSLKSFEDVVAEASEGFRSILCERSGASKLLDLLAKAPDERLLVVGPEGGFSSAETKIAVGLGFEAASLGSHVLRSETAALVSVAFACLDSRATVE